ncbi:NTP/NDP exchange transporter [Kangiella koreensis]|uniref:ATP/ADP translocase-like protein n=1 Tax=Kangiella koreensis (strain DSM 16069 / JCM 12317 / KCTC 12182 / SW-125) TaxID=523791 RepID=C7R6D8_KANKD|nr:ATP/ADP translocase-like protein [Kangiella koreensis]ACV27366.1 ATP/ADP translocase-like protein [Kangiella koreensis DSM 16069]
MGNIKGKYSWLESQLTRVVKIRMGEGKSIALHFVTLFILMFSYYLLKVIRDPLILSESTAEVKSYSTSVQACLLLVLLPLFSKLYFTFSQHSDHSRFIRVVMLFFSTNLLLFALLYFLGLAIGIVFYIWLGIFSVVVVALYWAFCADCYSTDAGSRLFIFIAVGGAIGAWVGSQCAGWSYQLIGVSGIMGLSSVLLMTAAILTGVCYQSVPSRSKSRTPAVIANQDNWRLAILKIFKKPYLLLIATFIILINFINSMGEYILAKFVVDFAMELELAGEDKQLYMTEFYADYIAWITLFGLILQIFVVVKLFKWVGVGASILILPIIMMFNYTFVLYIPMFSVIKWTLVAENSVNYSIQNTTRHALFLPISREDKYIGKNVIEGFFYRFGDMLYGGVVAIGITFYGVDKMGFIMLNAMLAFCCTIVAFKIRNHYRNLEDEMDSLK